jgi:hypothetical protein
MRNSRIIATVPSGIAKAVEKAADKIGCSKAEVVRLALYEHLLHPIERHRDSQ